MIATSFEMGNGQSEIKKKKKKESRKSLSRQTLRVGYKEKMRSGEEGKIVCVKEGYFLVRSWLTCCWERLMT